MNIALLQSLYISISEFSENTKSVEQVTSWCFIEQIMNNNNYDIEDRTDRRIISIDPEKVLILMMHLK